MSDRLVATIIRRSDGDRLFINDAEFPWPINLGHPDCIMHWDGDDFGNVKKRVLDVEIVVDEVQERYEH